MVSVCACVCVCVCVCVWKLVTSDDEAKKDPSAINLLQWVVHLFSIPFIYVSLYLAEFVYYDRGIGF